MKVVNVRLVVEDEVAAEALPQTIIEDDENVNIFGAQVLENNGAGHLLPTGARFIILGGEAGVEVEALLQNPG